MKTSQLIGAGVIFVILMIGVFFSMQYVPTQTSSVAPPVEVFPALSFFTTKFPEDGVPAEVEHKKPGYHDFWFVNNQAEPVHFGGLSKTCKCQGVEVFVLPEDYPAKLESAENASGHAARRETAAVGLAALEPISSALLAAAMTPERMSQLEKVAEQTVLHSASWKKPDDSLSVTVQPGRLGWLRMLWTGEKPGPQQLGVRIWYGHHDSGQTENLESRLNFLEPLMYDNDLLIGSLSVRDLPRESSFVCWSATRPDFVLKAETPRPDWRPEESDPFVVGKPVRLTREEIAAHSHNAPTGIACAYRVPVTLRPVASDGKTLFDLGIFRRRVLVTCDDEEPLTVLVRGVVEGDVRVGAGDDHNRISFGNVYRNGGRMTRSIDLASQVPGMKLELLDKRTPPFLDAKLTEEAGDELGKVWRLVVTLKPTATGRFPRDDDPAYRESAVYVRSPSHGGQTVRIPVEGDVVDR